jgi:hypothetical protein
MKVQVYNQNTRRVCKYAEATLDPLKIIDRGEDITEHVPGYQKRNIEAEILKLEHLKAFGVS